MITADIVVIGGGIAGISAAAELAREALVVVLEQEQATGYHSTGRSAAMFVKNYGNATLRALNAIAEPFLMGEGEAPAVLSQRGELLVASEAELDTFNAYLDGSAGLERLTTAEAQSLVPILRPEAVVAAAYEPAAHDIDVDLMFQSYVKALRKRGGQIVTNAEAQTIARTGDVWRVETGAGSFEAPIIVNAAGAWADHVAHLAGVHPVGLSPLRRSAAILPAPDGHDVTQWPLFVSASEDWYARPEAGKLMVSPADEDPVEPHDAWPDDMVLAEGLNRYEQAVTVPVTRVERSWAGLRTFAPDRSPVVGFASDVDGFFWLAGQGGYGIQTSPALSRFTAATIFRRGSELSETTIAALSPARFDDTSKGLRE
ncbi:NAD(P)/FAD-dependent oxidoreductase [Aliiroseovarius sp. YM-037]|uniref:NAD(P)/FAD-dependent oxidoreductase n=1 Tax=Aliiroseovarius sp. YM-037 TaxID=3341728 RepID=UPI003A7F96EA